MAKKIEIKGLSTLLKKVNELGEVVQEDVNITIREGVNEMNNQAVRNIGSQGLVDTGFLRNNQQFIDRGNRKYSVINSAKYAPFHEFGTGGLVQVPADWGEIAAQFKGKGLRVVNIRPRPFLVPAFNQYSKIIVKDVEDIVNDALK